MYDSGDDAISGTGTSYGTTGDTEAPPGETATINASTSLDGSREAAARYELVVTCASMMADGVYCG